MFVHNQVVYVVLVKFLSFYLSVLYLSGGIKLYIHTDDIRG